MLSEKGGTPDRLLNATGARKSSEKAAGTINPDGLIRKSDLFDL